jgi:uncharacterized protein DUF4124
MRRSIPIAIIAGSLSLGSPAGAEIYKYKNKNGTVIYTDNLAQLPPEMREFYNKQREEREEKRRQLEKAVGREELERREAEAKKAELQRAQLEEAERQRRIAAIDAQLKLYQAKDKERESQKTMWQRRMKTAKDRLEKELADYKKVSEEYENIAIKPSFTLLPGEAEAMEKAKEQMMQLEAAIDKDVLEIEVTIPEEARKAGVPPGWIR